MSAKKYYAVAYQQNNKYIKKDLRFCDSDQEMEMYLKNFDKSKSLIVSIVSEKPTLLLFSLKARYTDIYWYDNIEKAIEESCRLMHYLEYYRKPDVVRKIVSLGDTFTVRTTLEQINKYIKINSAPIDTKGPVSYLTVSINDKITSYQLEDNRIYGPERVYDKNIDEFYMKNISNEITLFEQPIVFMTITDKDESIKLILYKTARVAIYPLSDISYVVRHYIGPMLIYESEIQYEHYEEKISFDDNQPRFPMI